MTDKPKCHTTCGCKYNVTPTSKAEDFVELSNWKEQSDQRSWTIKCKQCGKEERWSSHFLPSVGWVSMSMKKVETAK